MKLIYVNALGPNYNGQNIYEFIFSNQQDIWGEEWDSEPASGKPFPPQINFIERVGVLKNSNIEFNLIQNSDFFSMYDAIDDVIALAWEIEDDENISPKDKRLVFRFGEDIKIIEDKLYERDIVLTYEKHLFENEK